ncbi:hypothetical protein STENM36S_02067 [Streptomyces tendae]
MLWGLTGVGGWPQTERAPGGDVAMLRQDQLFLAEDGTPWVRTDPAPDVADDDIRWHRVPRDTYAWLADEGFFAEDGTGAQGEGGRRRAGRRVVGRRRARGGRRRGRCWYTARQPGPCRAAARGAA